MDEQVYLECKRDIEAVKNRLLELLSQHQIMKKALEDIMDRSPITQEHKIAYVAFQQMGVLPKELQ